jgi:hypothetical protein
VAKWGGRFDTVDFRQQGADFIECKSMKERRAVGDWFPLRMEMLRAN